jgi:hypothetical protein
MVVSDQTFHRAMVSLRSCLPHQQKETVDTSIQEREYYRLVIDLDEADFTDGVDDIILNDTWFPAVSRIREAAAAHSHKRARAHSVSVVTGYVSQQVCPTCAGAHWIRLGGYDALNQHAGEEGSRVVPCPHCTTNGRYDRGQELRTIASRGGVPDPNGGYVPDMATSVWRLPRTLDNRPDLDALYFESRRLRAERGETELNGDPIDPLEDKRQDAPTGWKTLGKVFA